MSEEEEVAEKKGVVQRARKSRNLKGSEAKLESGSRFWKSLMTTILGGFRLAHGDEYDRAVAKVEKVFSSVSYIHVTLLCLIFFPYLVRWNGKLRLF